MIDIKELRIGNAVLDPIGMEKEVSLQVLQKIERGFKYTPIPLTPEILEKCGFEKCSCGGWKHGIHISKYDNGKLYYKTVIIKYLHQLQNLYFALTGEELTFKP